MSFTEGKWKIEKRYGHSADGERSVITAESVDRIAVISHRGVRSIKEADDNARLIAAAPELYRACEDSLLELNLLLSLVKSKKTIRWLPNRNEVTEAIQDQIKQVKAAIAAGGGKE